MGRPRRAEFVDDFGVAEPSIGGGGGAREGWGGGDKLDIGDGDGD